MPRLFVGTFLSDEGVEKLESLARANQHLPTAWNAKIRWVDRTKLHITWMFLGEIKSETIPDLISALQSAFGSEETADLLVTLRYDRFELWPNERKARLGVITPSVVPDQVFTIDATIKKALKPFIPKDQQQHERKDFEPHVTVLRFPRDYKPRHRDGLTPLRKPKNADVDIPANIFPIQQVVNEIALIESDLGKKTQGYEKLFTIKL